MSFDLQLLFLDSTCLSVTHDVYICVHLWNRLFLVFNHDLLSEKKKKKHCAAVGTYPHAFNLKKTVWVKHLYVREMEVCLQLGELVSKYNVNYRILVLLVSILFWIVQHEFMYKNPHVTFQKVFYDTWIITLWVGTFVWILDTIISPMNIKIFSHLNFQELIIMFKNLAFF